MSATIAIPISSLWFFLAVAAFLAIALAISRIPFPFVLKRLLLLEPFVLGIGLLSMFQAGGMRVFLTLVTKSTLCLLSVIILSNTTPFALLLNVLRRIHVPALLVTVLALMYRYIFLLIDEAERMGRARKSRTFGRKRVGRWRQAATVVGQLFVRSTERAERIFAAMTARGWQ
jgi:cobalt/nickel transport system permease protein